MKRIISASLIAATLSIFFADTNPLFAQVREKYQRFRGTTSGSGECDYYFNRLFTDPDFIKPRLSKFYPFDEGFVYKGLFDGQSAEVLLVRHDRIGVCRYFRTSDGIVYKTRLGSDIKKAGESFLIYNGKEVKLSSKVTRSEVFVPINPISFIDSKGIKHSFFIYNEIIPNP